MLFTLRDAVCITLAYYFKV